MKNINQLVISFLGIALLVAVGLSLNLNRLFYLISSHDEIEEEWTELQHVLVFEDALDNLIFNLTSDTGFFTPQESISLTWGGKSIDFSFINLRKIKSVCVPLSFKGTQPPKVIATGDFLAMNDDGGGEIGDSIREKLKNIKVCAIELPIEGQWDDDHGKKEQKVLIAMRTELDNFLSEFGKEDIALLKNDRPLLNEYLLKLSRIKSLEQDLQEIYMEGVRESLNFARQLSLQVKNQTIIFSFLLVIIVCLAAVLATVLIKKSTSEILSKERLNAIMMLVKSLTHEIRNPLGIIKSSASVIKMDVQSPQNRELTDYLIEEVDRINGLLEQLLDLGSPRKMDMRHEDIPGIINPVIKLLEADVGKSGIRINYQDHGRGVKVLCNKNQIKQLMINLLLNAIDASPPRGVIDVTTDAGPWDYKVAVRDHGQGLDSIALKKIFDPFYTTKAKGTGLGMMLVKKIADDHQARISIENKVNEGVCFTVHLRTNGRKKED